MKIVQNARLAHTQAGHEEGASLFQLFRAIEKMRPLAKLGQVNSLEMAILCSISNPRDNWGLIFNNINSSRAYMKWFCES